MNDLSYRPVRTGVAEMPYGSISALAKHCSEGHWREIGRGKARGKLGNIVGAYRLTVVNLVVRLVNHQGVAYVAVHWP